ncbi:MAG: DUF4337 family protein [Flavisolibacter sp.]
MEEFDDPTESLHDRINEEARERKEERRWSLWVAISTALFAVLAAIASLFAGHYSNEALIDQIKASDQWAYYQAKSIKLTIVTHAAKPDSAAAAKFSSDEAAIQKVAREKEGNSEYLLQKHVQLAKAVTLFQIAIAISAISIVSSKRFLWVIAVVIALVALVFFFTGIL